MNVEERSMQPDPDSAGCLCVVASYATAAPVVDAVTAEAAERLMMSPMLGDFIELRFANMGPQPGQAAERSVAVRRITDELMRPRGGVGRNYFALMIVDQSAATVEQVLGECATFPFLAALPIRLRGIASCDERRTRPDGAASAEIVVSPTGSWSHGDLVAELRRYGDELLRHYAAGQKHGLTHNELGVLRTRYQEHAVPEHEPEGAVPGAPPPPDVLSVQSNSPQLHESQQIQQDQTRRPGEAQQAGVPDEPESEGGSAGLMHPVPPEPALPKSRPRPRWLPEMHWLRAQRARQGSAAESAGPRTRGLVYLLVTGDAITDDRAAWNRSRSALLEVDAKIAAAPGIAYQVRALQGDEETLRGELREAGHLTRRDLRHPVTDADFAGVLEEIRAMLRQDRTLVEVASAPVARSAVVFFALDPPLADTIAAEVFRDLAQEVSILWVLPKPSADLVAPAFTEAPGVQVIVDNEGVAEEVATLLVGNPPSAAAELETYPKPRAEADVEHAEMYREPQ